MKMRELIEEYLEEYLPDVSVILLDGFDDAIVGVLEGFDSEYCLAYDRNKIIEILKRDMTEEEAFKYYEYNIIGAYLGKNIPKFLIRFEA